MAVHRFEAQIPTTLRLLLGFHIARQAREGELTPQRYPLDLSAVDGPTNKTSKMQCDERSLRTSWRASLRSSTARSPRDTGFCAAHSLGS